MSQPFGTCDLCRAKLHRPPNLTARLGLCDTCFYGNVDHICVARGFDIQHRTWTTVVSHGGRETKRRYHLELRGSAPG